MHFYTYSVCLFSVEMHFKKKCNRNKLKFNKLVFKEKNSATYKCTSFILNLTFAILLGLYM